jgi:hypothetical protein
MKYGCNLICALAVEATQKRNIQGTYQHNFVGALSLSDAHHLHPAQADALP